jgi:H/ACA ribonucleoprotein complex subunit 4
MAQRKKSLIKEGKLDKHGKPNDNTPSNWREGYKDLSGASVVAPLGGSSAPSTPAKKEDAAKMDVDTPNGGGSDSDSDEKPSAKKEKKKKVSSTSWICFLFMTFSYT